MSNFLLIPSSVWKTKPFLKGLLILFERHPDFHKSRTCHSIDFLSSGLMVTGLWGGIGCRARWFPLFLTFLLTFLFCMFVRQRVLFILSSRCLVLVTYYFFFVIFLSIVLICFMLNVCKSFFEYI